ncbi:MAG: hypothetical protein ACK54H_07090, partial [Phycisphaerales bacterium]
APMAVEAMEQAGADAAVIVGPDWCSIDADLGSMTDGASSHTKKVVAVIIADAAMSGIGAARDLTSQYGASTVIQTTIDALSEIDSIDSIAIVCRDETSMCSAITRHDGLRFVVSSVSLWDRRDVRARSIAAARARASHCWRGAIANLTVYDEAFFAPMAVEAMEQAGADAAVIVGPDWCSIDADLVHKTVARYRENPERNKITFSQAPAGKGVCVISLDIAQELCANYGPAATIGGLLAYHPVAPQSDPIAKPQCVQIDASLRDGLGRFIADSVGRRIGVSSPMLWNIALESSQELLPLNSWRTLFASLAQSIEEVSVQIDGRQSDSRLVEQLVSLARSEGVAHVHLVLDIDSAPRLFNLAADVITVDFGVDASAPTRNAWLKTLEMLEPISGTVMPRRWLVPTITRCDSTLGELEEWYDFWLLHRGTAVIQSPRDSEVARIQPMPIPDFVQNYQDNITVHVSANGTVTHRSARIGMLAKDHALAILDRLGVRSCELATAGSNDE